PGPPERLRLVIEGDREQRSAEEGENTSVAGRSTTLNSVDAVRGGRNSPLKALFSIRRSRWGNFRASR
ncbi:hypothetical protein GWI33_006155, partial [Rhynchophorus ferrugineus]